MKTNVKFLFTFPLPIFFVFVFAGVFSACTAEEEELKIFASKEGRFDLNENEFVSLRIFPDEVSNNSFAIRKLENQTTRYLGYGNEFSLKYYNKSNWESISLYDEMWEKIYLALSAGEIIEEQMNLFSLIKKYNKSKKGRYLYTQRFDLISDWPSGNSDMIVFSLSTEFEIK